MNRIYPIAIILGCLVNLSQATAQYKDKLTLAEAYDLAMINYPLTGQKSLLEKQTELSLDIIRDESLPNITANLEGQLQTESLQLGSDSPESPINVEVPRESYKAYAQLDYTVYEGGQTTAQKDAVKANLQVGLHQLKTDLRSLKDRVNELFFIIVLSLQQEQLIGISLNNISASLQTLEAGFNNGTILESELVKLKVRKLELLNEQEDIRSNYVAAISVLEELTGLTLSPTTMFILPSFDPDTEVDLQRPEQGLYNAQKLLLTAQEGSIKASRRPRVVLFAQGGVGYPNPLNFTDISHSPYALAGLRMTWKIWDWNAASQKTERLQIQQQQVDVRKRTFEYNIQTRENEFIEKIEALSRQIENHKNIVVLQNEVLQQSKAQLKNGVINATDYLIQVNAELEARQTLQLYELQLQQLQVKYLTLFGML
ncbi:TolC family protein [Fulvivirga sp. 29W222]|uniref:TolC family protein n=1 Tax=Fulvivirga marina TaxID=2494733 RepID=A0A937FY42_9BACT|nr:TolC family protein [Fulvivirga marina]MBL6448270.1 TolC family protein [Fulvivirga marina]